MLEKLYMTLAICQRSAFFLNKINKINLISLVVHALCGFIGMSLCYTNKPNWLGWVGNEKIRKNLGTYTKMDTVCLFATQKLSHKEFVIWCKKDMINLSKHIPVLHVFITKLVAQKITFYATKI